MRRRLIILGIIAAVIACALALFYFTIIRTGPSCTDGIQNQNEEGIDCGGSCKYLCTDTQANVSVRFVRPIANAGRTDVIAYIDNPNTTSAAKSLPYTVELYGADNVVLARGDGKVDLPPSATVPVFIPNVYSGTEPVTRAFVTVMPPSHFWYRYMHERVVPNIRDVVYTGGDAPRITANAVNTTTTTLRDLTFVATVFGKEEKAIGASQTVVSAIMPGRTAPLVFTWNAPFAEEVSYIEVVPVTPVIGP